MWYDAIDTESVITVKSKTTNIDEIISVAKKSYINFSFISAEYLGQSNYTSRFEYVIKFRHTTHLKPIDETLHS
jgi:hypothetical protein